MRTAPLLSALATIIALSSSIPAHASIPFGHDPQGYDGLEREPAPSAPAPPPATRATSPIAYHHFVVHQRGRARSTVHVVAIDTRDPSVQLRVSTPAERHQTVPAWARRVGAAVAINGDFFLPGAIPVGPARGAGVDWPAHPGAYFGAILAQRPGMTPEVLDHVPDARYPNFISSMDRIVVGGAPFVDPRVVYAPGRHPRTAVGYLADGHTMVFVVVDGRNPVSSGMTVPELRDVMVSLGATEALMMDGGGSSTLYLAGRGVLNHPGGPPRRVANHIAIVLRPPVQSARSCIPSMAVANQ